MKILFICKFEVFEKKEIFWLILFYFNVLRVVFEFFLKDG